MSNKCVCKHCKKEFTRTFSQIKQRNYRCHKCRYKIYQKAYGEKFFKKYPWLKRFYSLYARCNKPAATGYKTYGGRGIKALITREEMKRLWNRDKAHLLKKPSIDRIDNDGNYTYANCRFIELRENAHLHPPARGERIAQHKLTEADVRHIKYNCCSLSPSVVAKRYNVTPTAIWSIVTRRNWKWV